MSDRAPLSAFAGYGIEIEYAIVARDTLDVLPVADRLLEAAAGSAVNEYADGSIGWSNELSLHVVELKTNGPAPQLHGLAGEFASALARIDTLLEPLGARVLPGAMHPWMDPLTEQRLWPHEQNEIYAAYDRIFDCRGHGWANLQSMHINLPFANDEEFVRLHDAIRVVLPLLPALAAGSPFRDGRVSGLLDTRLEVYRLNQRRVPEITGRVIPDRVASIDEYHGRILAPLYAAIAPHDPDGVLRGEWLNSRGAIARFERGAIEIRVLDAQECPAADLAIARLVVAVVRELYEAKHASPAAQAAPDTSELADVFERTLREGERTVIASPALLAALGLPPSPITAGVAWGALAARAGVLADAEFGADIHTLLTRGPLARWLLEQVPAEPSRNDLRTLYGRMAAALNANRMCGRE